MCMAVSVCLFLVVSVRVCLRSLVRVRFRISVSVYDCLESIFRSLENRIVQRSFDSQIASLVKLRRMEHLLRLFLEKCVFDHPT